MLQFNIKGKILDLPEGVNLSITRKNNAFTFGSWATSRTTTFKVPATSKNNEIFKCANNFIFRGAEARIIHDVVLMYEGGFESGFLYIVSANKEEYECTFLFGGLSNLKKMSEAGKIADNYIFTNEDEEGVFADEIKSPSKLLRSKTFDVIRYYVNRDNSVMMPSVRLWDLLKDTERLFGITIIDNSLLNLRQLRLILNSCKHLVHYEVGGDKIEDVELGTHTLIKLRHNFPAFTYIELIQIIARLSGCFVRLEENKMIFEQLTREEVYNEDGEIVSEEWKVISLKNVTKEEKLTRNYNSYAQHNIVSFSSSNVEDSFKIILDYEIENKTLSYYNALYTFPFSEAGGANVIQGLPLIAKVDDLKKSDGKWEIIAKNATITKENNDVYLGYIQGYWESEYYAGNYAEKVVLISDACDFSTSFEITCKMSMFEFNKIKENNILFFRGMELIWTDATWNKGLAKFNVSRVR